LAGLLGRFASQGTFQTLSKIDDLRSGASMCSASANIPSVEEMSVITGTIEFYNQARGFGLVQPDDGGRDAFVHATAVGKHELV
jgi:hypothetical protein